MFYNAIRFCVSILVAGTPKKIELTELLMTCSLSGHRLGELRARTDGSRGGMKLPWRRRRGFEFGGFG